MPTVGPRYNPRSYLYLYHNPGLAIGQLVQVELCFERPGFEHTHGDWQVMAVLDGEASVKAGGDEHLLRPGSVCVVPPRVMHVTQTPPGHPRFTLVDLRLKLQPVVEMTHHLERVTGGKVVSWLDDPQRVGGAAGALREVLTRPDRPDPPHMLWPLWQMLARPLDPVAPGHAPPFADSRVLYVVTLMREHPDRPLSMDDLAGRVQLSSSQLGRLFREHLGTSPGAYLQQLRLEQARQYLTSSTMSVKQIAAACGFGNSNHFSRLFHEQVGTTPTAYRKREAEGAA